MPKCDFNKVAKQLYWNHTSVWVLSCKLATYFQNTCRLLLLKICTGALFAQRKWNFFNVYTWTDLYGFKVKSICIKIMELKTAKYLYIFECFHQTWKRHKFTFSPKPFTLKTWVFIETVKTWYIIFIRFQLNICFKRL